MKRHYLLARQTFTFPSVFFHSDRTKFPLFSHHLCMIMNWIISMREGLILTSDQTHERIWEELGRGKHDQNIVYEKT